MRMQLALGPVMALLVIHPCLQACDKAAGELLGRAGELDATGRLDQLDEHRLRTVLNDCRDADPLTRARLFHTLGLAVQSRGRVSEAESLYRKSLSQWQRSAHGSSLLGALPLINNLTVVSLQLGRLSAAEHYARLSVSVTRDAGPGHSRDLALSWNNLAVVLRHRGKRAEASRFLASALEFWSAHPGVWPVEEAAARGNFGALWVRDGKLQKALEPLETAVKLLETVSASHPNLPAVLQSLAEVYAGFRQYREADEALARALRIQTALTGEENELVVQMLHARSAVLERIGRKKEAAQLSRHADDIWKFSSVLRAARNVVDVAELQRRSPR